MHEKIKIYLSFILLFVSLIRPSTGLSANFIWTQSDWSGGADQGATGLAHHPGDQTGWTKYYSQDPYVNTLGAGEITLLPQPASSTQTSDVGDFDRGVLTNLVLIGQGTKSTTRKEEGDPAIARTGSWSSANDANQSGGGYIFSNTVGSQVTLTFTGNEASWIGPKGLAFGIADIYLDDIFQGSVDLYSGTTQFQQALWNIQGLPNTTHKLTIIVSGQKNASAINTYVGIDAFDLVVLDPDPGAFLILKDTISSFIQTSDVGDFDRGVLTNLVLKGQGTKSTTRKEESDPAIARTGSWSSASDANQSGGSYIFSNTVGSQVTLTFTGIEASWIGPKGLAFGIADIYLDDIFQGSVDLYSGTTQHQQALWNIKGLPNTTHKLTIIVSGLKNASAINTYVGIDAFDVVVGSPDAGAYLMLVDGATTGTYESPSFDAGSEGVLFSSISWTAAIPAGSGLKFQIATNDDNRTWNFIGPDGTSTSFYTTPGASIYAGHRGDRYIKYRVLFERPTVNPQDSPVLHDVTITYGIDTGGYESPSFDLGLGGAFYTSLAWNADVPIGSTLKFQIATNNDNQTWNFLGPDGTSTSSYVTSGTPIYQGHNRDRYIKYQVMFERQTVNPQDSPRLDDVTIHYRINPAYQSLIGSPYDSTDDFNAVNRLMWSENLPEGTDIALQLRTSPDGAQWGPWLGPNNTTFSATRGVSTIQVANASGFAAGSRVTMTNSADPGQMEVKNINAIDIANKTITLNSPAAYDYASNSVLTDTYAEAEGTVPVNPIHRMSNDDRWFQYRLFLFTSHQTETPVFLENKIGYFSSKAIYQPDGLIDGSGDNIYGAAGTGGESSKFADPGFIIQQPLTFDILVQNDGNPESIDDTYRISWNTPSDISGTWTVSLNDGSQDLQSPISVPLSVGAEKAYRLKVIPSANAPADSTQDIVIDIKSENNFARLDSIKASTRVRTVFQGDGIIDTVGDNLYDPSRGGNGGTSILKEAGPGESVLYDIRLQNEGNIGDSYTISLTKAPPEGWSAIINDGTTDHNITNPSNKFSTPSIPPPPSSGSTVTYTLKIIPKGSPTMADIILNIRSNEGARDMDSLTARLNLKGIYNVDGILYGFGYDGTGEIRGGGVSGSGCGTMGPGDNTYGAPGSGNGGCAATDISAGATGLITLGVQNEGNIPDTYGLLWTSPPGWSIGMQERLNNGTVVEYGTPVDIPTQSAGNPAAYNAGEVPFFTFKITPPATFTSGSQIIIFDIRSKGDATKSDSVKAIINSSDTTPPASVLLSTLNITDTSVTVSWTAPGDDGTSGTATSYDLRYSSTPITSDTDFTKATKVRSCKSGESNLGRPRPAGSPESCTVSQLFANRDHYFALKTSDEAGNVSPLSTCPACPARTLTSSDTTRPGTIADLTVTDATKDTVTVCWTAPADDGTAASSGPVTGYELRYSTRYIADDGMTPGVGVVPFSSALPATPVEGFLPPKSPGERECYIVPVENKIDTGGGVLDNRIRNTRFYFAIKALDERGIDPDKTVAEAHRSLISNIAGVLTPLVPYAYNMVSVPYVPNPNTPQEVFGDDVGKPLNVYRWDSRGPNFDSGCYDGEPGPYSGDPTKYACTRLTAIKEGVGYFLWAPPDDVILDVPPASTKPATQGCVDDVGGAFQCYVSPLQGGWNMVGPPFDKEINFSSRDVGGRIEKGLYVRRTSGARVDIATFQDAVTARNWIDGSIYTYNGVNYTYETCDKDKPGELLGARCSLVMQPWKAYWIRMHVLGGATFELLVPE